MDPVTVPVQELPCPSCAVLVPSASTFCPTCGLYLDDGLPLEIFRKTATQEKRAWVRPALLVALGVISYVLAHFMFLLGLIATLLLAVAFASYLLRGGLKCPACQVRHDLDAVRTRDLAFCSNCGVRFRSGTILQTPILLGGKTVSAGTRCGFCGEALGSDSTFCGSCGANVLLPPESDLPPTMSALLDKGRCPGCRFELSRIRGKKRVIAHCPLCGTFLGRQAQAGG